MGKIINLPDEGTATSCLRALPTRKEQVDMFVYKVTSDVLEGNFNPLQAWVEIKNIETALEKIKEKIKFAAIAEREKYGKESELYGAKVTIIESGVKYDYSVCGDTKHEIISQELERVKNELKDREKFLKSIPSGEKYTDEETGFEVCSPTKKSTTTLKVE